MLPNIYLYVMMVWLDVRCFHSATSQESAPPAEWVDFSPSTALKGFSCSRKPVLLLVFTFALAFG